MIVLGLDSATECASCALLKDGRLLGDINFNYKKQHSVILMSIIDSLIKVSSITVNDIDAFVVSKGPGSFTGLRIGAALVKGLSDGVDKPFTAVSSLDALAYNLAFTEGIICPIIDALRGNVYTSIYSFQGETLERNSDYLVLSIEELIDKLKGFNKRVTFVGDAVPVFKDKLQSEIRDAYFSPAHLNIVRAAALCEIGEKLIAEGHLEDSLSFAPIYLRLSQAEREYQKKLEQEKNE